MTRDERNWTIVQLHYRDPTPVVSDRYPFGWAARCEYYVVDEPLKSKAKIIVQDWLDAHPEQALNLARVDYYPRNYVDQARRLRTEGRVIA